LKVHDAQPSSIKPSPSSSAPFPHSSGRAVTSPCVTVSVKVWTKMRPLRGAPLLLAATSISMVRVPPPPSAVPPPASVPPTRRSQGLVDSETAVQSQPAGARTSTAIRWAAPPAVTLVDATEYEFSLQADPLP
jgi:hypothetical protein